MKQPPTNDDLANTQLRIGYCLFLYLTERLLSSIIKTEHSCEKDTTVALGFSRGFGVNYFHLES